MSDAGRTGANLTYSAVIPTKDRPQRAVSAVVGLLAQTQRPERVVVVDASTPPLETPPSLRQQAAEAGVDLVVIHAEPSTSAQRNLGVRHVESPIVFFVDDDVVVPPHYVATLLRRWERDGIHAFGGLIGSPALTARRRNAFISLLRRAFMLHYSDPRGHGTTFRPSRKLRYVDRPHQEVRVPAVGAGAVAYRTELARKHPFDERFPGYALGEDLDMSFRLGADAPILQIPDVEWIHAEDPGDRSSKLRWYYRGRRETYFRLRHLERRPLAVAAFVLSIAAEAGAAAVDSLRERDPSHVCGFVGGFVETLRDVREQSVSREQLTLKPRAYYAANRAYQRARIARGRLRSEPTTWQGVRVLGYHRIVDGDDMLAITPDQFRRHLKIALERGLKPIRLDAALDLLREPVEGSYFCVTFDDGYADNFTNAVPILRELGVAATIFVPSGVIDGYATYHWYRDAPPAMTWEQVETIVGQGLVDVQAHGRTHRPLPRLTEAQAREEISGSKRDIESHVPYALTSFCYPAGLYGEREVELVREAGFYGAVTTEPGVNAGGEPLVTLRRTMINWGDREGEFEAKISGLLDRSSPIRDWLHHRRSRGGRVPVGPV